ncbi:MAG TPA: peptidylprolyl isomerase [Parasegetibacter sp.]
MKKYALLLAAFSLVCQFGIAQKPVKLKKKDRKKDIEMVTTEGTIILRLSDSTPIHRDHFISLVKGKFYDGILFHRIIKEFMIQAGDPFTKPGAAKTSEDSAKTRQTIPAEFVKSLFHKRGALAAARMGDNVNPEKASSYSQFYIVQGKKFTDGALDTLETFRLKGRKIPVEHREVYKTEGGAPHLDQDYTVFGEVVSGIEVVDRIAETSVTTQGDGSKKEARIVKVSLVKRKKLKR